MSEPLASGDAFRIANDEVEEFRAKSTRAKKAQALRDAEQRIADERLQSVLKADTMRRNPGWFS